VTGEPTHDELRLLVGRSTAGRITRRRLLGLGAAGAAATALGLAACRDDRRRGGGQGATGVDLEDALSIFSWDEYQSPDTTEQFADAHGVDVRVDVFGSTEEALAKLALAGGSGYDLVVPTGAYIPRFVAQDLLQPLDKSKIPNLSNIDPQMLGQPWDPQNTYSVVKDWGSTGYLYDARVITSQLRDWRDFFLVAKQKGVSGKVSVLEVPSALTGLVFWRDGIDWTTTDDADLDHAEQVLREELAPHLRAFDSYPVSAMLEGAYVLSQAWNGYARVAVLEDPERYKWVLGAPKTELWVDSWTILANAQHPEAAHAWINYILDPEVSAREVDFHGFNTGVRGIEDFVPRDSAARDMIFFTEEELSRFVPLQLTAAFERTQAIFNTVRAAAGA
jgi:spermidine/putrescine transport system substrate-binding protein